MIIDIQLLETKGEVDLSRYKELTDLCGYVWYLYESGHEKDKRYEVLYCENISKTPYKKLYQFTYYYSPHLNPLVYNKNKKIKEMFGKYIVGSKTDNVNSYKYTLSTAGTFMLSSIASDDILSALKSIEREIQQKKWVLKAFK